MAGDVAEELFDVSEECLRQLASGPQSRLGEALLHFELRALRLLGFLGSIDRCAVCGRAWPGRQRGAWFSPREGGLVCSGCRSARSGLRAESLPGGIVDRLRRWAETSTIRPEEEIDRRTRGRLQEALSTSSVFFLERPLRMLQYRKDWL